MTCRLSSQDVTKQAFSKKTAVGQIQKFRVARRRCRKVTQASFGQSAEEKNFSCTFFLKINGYLLYRVRHFFGI